MNMSIEMSLFCLSDQGALLLEHFDIDAVITRDNQDLINAGVPAPVTWDHLALYFLGLSTFHKAVLSPADDGATPTSARVLYLWESYRDSLAFREQFPDTYADMILAGEED